MGLFQQLQGWFSGLVSKRFSATLRGLSQNLTLIVLFFGDNLLLRHDKFDWPTCLLVLAVPLCVMVFTLANNDMKEAATESPQQSSRTVRVLDNHRRKLSPGGDLEDGYKKAPLMSAAASQVPVPATNEGN